MSLRKKLSYNLVIQSIGPVLSFFTIFLIVKMGGPMLQGRYAVISAAINIAVVIGTFGFPQSFIYLINRLGVAHRKVIKISVYYFLGFLILCMPTMFLLFKMNWLDEMLVSDLGQIVILTFTISLLVLNGLLRGIYLTYNQSVYFGIFSILPSLMLFLFISITCIFKHNFNFHLIYLMSSVSTIGVALMIFRKVLQLPDNAPWEKFPWRPLLTHGTNVFLQALFVAVQPIIAYALIRNYIGSSVEIGYFNLGLVLVQGFLVPISMISPLLFEHWTKNQNERAIGNNMNRKLILISIILGGVLALLSSFFIPYVFGEEYAASIQAVQVILFSVPLIFHCRILMPSIHANGFPIFNTYSGALRLIVFVTLSLVCMTRINHELTSLAICWTVSEICAAFMTQAFYITMNRRNTVSQTI